MEIDLIEQLCKAAVVARPLEFREVLTHRRVTPDLRSVRGMPLARTPRSSDSARAMRQ